MLLVRCRTNRVQSVALAPAVPTRIYLNEKNMKNRDGEKIERGQCLKRSAHYLVAK